MPSVIAGQSRKRVWLLFVMAWAVASAGILTAAVQIGRNNAMSSLIDAAVTDARLKSALLNVALERPRALPLVLSGDPDVSAALRGEEGAAQKLNLKLEGLIPGTEASVLYVTDASGVAISSSNWSTKDSFVGVDFAFREYFKVATVRGQAEHYALGHVSFAPGLYIANRVDDENGTVLGVVIAKVEFPLLETEWRAGRKPVYVTDQNGIVLLTSIPEWRFKTTKPLSADKLSELSSLRQFGAAKLDPLPVNEVSQTVGDARIVSARNGNDKQSTYLSIRFPVPSTSWLLNYLQPTEATVSRYMREMFFSALAVLMPLIAASGYWLYRRHRIDDDRRAEREARDALERSVTERTRDLTFARDQLAIEVEQRESAEVALRQVQQRLVQANRLSILGQVAAGVAHEINQPVATIRTFADNSRKFLERGKNSEVDSNLQKIADLTERIGSITSDLKTLARKGRTAAQPVSLRSVIDGAVMLLTSRFAGKIDALEIDYSNADHMVLGSQIRLEQIVINLLQNALEAIADRSDGKVKIYSEVRKGEMALVVSDNGPGIDGDIYAQLFSPFNTSKEGGLGLGLVISSDIASDYGGRITVETSEEGTRFTTYLKLAGDKL